MVRVIREYGVPGGSSLCARCGGRVNAERRTGYVDSAGVGGFIRHHYSLHDGTCYEAFKARHQNFVEVKV